MQQSHYWAYTLRKRVQKETYFSLSEGRNKEVVIENGLEDMGWEREA